MCGLTAGFLGGQIEVTLRKPPPLDVAMDVDISGKDRVRLMDKLDLVAEACSSEVSLELPFYPSYEQALEASKRYSGFDRHFYPTCFVCGPSRSSGDGLRIFAGPLRDQQGVAAPWIPDTSLTGKSGSVRAEFVWAALDCPGYFAVNPDRHRYMLLGRMAADIRHRPQAGERCVVTAWPIGAEGRKHFAASALISATGRLLGIAKATWIETTRPD